MGEMAVRVKWVMSGSWLKVVMLLQYFRLFPSKNDGNKFGTGKCRHNQEHYFRVGGLLPSTIPPALDDTAAQALFSGIENHRLTWSDGSLRLLENDPAMTIFQRLDAACLVFLAIAYFCLAIQRVP